ncbi:MAG TPA: hypothetical protein PKZ07_16000 [Sedimentisphaerales bacterium]|nr:hypothetical protein [Sedimentisphaerales bacterium]
MGKMAHQTGGAISGLRQGGPTTANTGGSMAFKQDTPKSKATYQGGSADVKALGKASGGRIDTAKGKNVS